MQLTTKKFMLPINQLQKVSQSILQALAFHLPTTVDKEPNFVDSEFTIGVQIADTVAGALWRGVEKNKKTYSRMLIPRFPRDSNQKYVDYSYQICTDWKE